VLLNSPNVRRESLRPGESPLVSGCCDDCTRVDRWTAIEQRVSEGKPTVILQRRKHWIDDGVTASSDFVTGGTKSRGGADVTD